MKKKIDIAKDSDSELIELRILKKGLELAGLELRHCLRCDKWWGGYKKDTLPRACQFCKSPYWQTPRKIKKD